MERTVMASSAVGLMITTRTKESFTMMVAIIDWMQNCLTLLSILHFIAHNLENTKPNEYIIRLIAMRIVGYPIILFEKYLQRQITTTLARTVSARMIWLVNLNNDSFVLLPTGS